MAKKAQIVSTVTGTGSTTDLTVSGFGASTTIDGAIINIIGCTADDTDTNGVQVAIAYWDGTNIRCVAGFDEYGTATGVCKSSMSADVRFFDASGNVDCIGTISNITDGIRITWTDSPSSSWKIDATIFGGGVGVDVGDIAMSPTIDGTASYTGASATPDVVIASGGFVAASLPKLDTGRMYWNNGIAVNDGSATQFASALDSRGARNSTEIQQMHHTDRINATIGNFNEKELTAFNTDGFTITTRVGTTSSTRISFICLSGLENVAIDTGLSTASTGSTSISGIGFEPDFAMFMRGRSTALDSEYTNLNNESVLGFTDGTVECCSPLFGDDAAADMVPGQRHSAQILDTYQGDGELYDADFTSFDSGGLTVNVNVAGISTGATLMLQFEAGGAPPADNSVPWMSWF